MKKLKKYKFTVEDEAHLTIVSRFSLTLPAIIGAVTAFAIISIILAVLIIMFSPLRTLLPGYMNNSQRFATEDNLLRLDSLTNKYAENQAYIDNFIHVLDDSRVPTDSAAIAMIHRELPSDSLSGPSGRESAFVSQMEEREKYNISVLAPLAAEGMIFSPVSSDGLFIIDSRQSEVGRILATGAGPVLSPADGSVIASYYSWSDHGYELVIQHDRGFITAYRNTGVPLVGIGDIVNAGQAVALAPDPDSKGRREFSLRIWHNGLPVIPYEYVGVESNQTPDTPFEAPRGR